MSNYELKAPCGCEITWYHDRNGLKPCALHGAAPEMLDALKGLIAKAESSPKARNHPLVKAAIAAVAQAEGRG